MNIPVILYHISRIFEFVSLGLEAFAVIVLAYGSFTDDYRTKTVASRELFKSGKRIRNSVILFLLLLFLIADRSTTIEGASILVSISNICRLYAFGSIAIFGAVILLSIIIALRRISFEDTKELCRNIWNSAVGSIAIGFLLASFFYIP